MCLEQADELKMSVPSECSDLDVLKTNVTCPKCKELFKEAKLLPCLHCACVSCLSTEKGVRKHEGLKYMVSCPVCREERELPKTGLSSLPDATFKTTMVKLYRLLEGRGGRCEECKTTEASSIKSLCDRCGFVCDTCVDNHKKLRAYCDHNTISLKENGGSGGKTDLSEFLRPVAATGKLTCSQHSGEPLTIYCKTCKRLVCRECTLTHHKQPYHHNEAISSVIATQKDEVKKCLSSMHELHSELSTVIEDSCSAKEEIDHSCQPSRFDRDSPVFWPPVPFMSR